MEVDVLYNEDCLLGMQRLPDGSVDMILTDIPYGVVSRPSGGIHKLDKGTADVVSFTLADLAGRLARACKGSVYIFCSTEQVSELRALMVSHGFTTRLGIWEKTNPCPMNGQHLWLSSIECCVFARRSKAVFNEHCESPVWRFPNGSSKIHPTQKPAALFERLILASSNPGDLILDPCMGSGTTAIACLDTGRHYIGFEKDPGYFAIAQKRIAEHKPQLSLTA
jgi:site-specific DNA-methyltransferase (adenine-specific)